METEEKAKTKGEALVEFVLNRYSYSKNEMLGKQGKWREFYEDYRGSTLANKEAWQANYIVPSLKECIRIKTPLYMNILFSAGIKSFDVEAVEENDEPMIPLIKSLTTYDLNNVGRDRSGLFGQWEAYIKQFEIYGYTIAKIPWKKEKNKKGELIFEGPDMEVWDIFSVYPDPGVNNIGGSWIILQKKDIFVSYLRMLEDGGTYHSIKDLEETSQPGDDDTTKGVKKDDRVELLEYHGEIPKSLLEGEVTDEEQTNPYEDKYVDAIITIANGKVCIRNEEYPYDCGNIFIDSCKDRMPNEQFGIGTGEDIQAMAAELTNAHNKFSDAVNLIANPMGIVNPQKLAGLSNILIAHPGKLFVANPMVDNVAHALHFIDTTAAASALSPLIKFIDMMDKRIQKLSQAVPSISPSPSKKELHPTLGGTLLMQANAAEPLKHVVKHALEPAFQKMLEIFYKHNIQHLSKASAYRVLGKKKAERWFKEKKRREITKEDIKLQGNPDFIPRGVSVFAEKQVEIQNLLTFLEISLKALVPKLDPMGNPTQGEDGKTVMENLVDIREIIKRLAQIFGFKDIEKLIPSLIEEREREEMRTTAGEAEKITSKAGIPTPATPKRLGVTPPMSSPLGTQRR
ncbi:MAG: hypothetical protein E3J83_04370 [Candidatus Atribacteria bacterium]|nr:MAG: hypothetical protein E3J83_04370 [Candidatus Atribacteria bacterium]